MRMGHTMFGIVNLFCLLISNLRDQELMQLEERLPSPPESQATAGPAPFPFCHTQRFRRGLVFKAHRLLDHSTLGLRIIRKNLSTS